MPDDVLSQLLEFSWKGISFPVSSFDTTITQDHAEHKWPDRDGAHIEATGRAPILIHAKAMFRSNIAPGKTESWSTLYPTQFRNFLIVALDRTSGTLQHPELGNITCKLKSAEVSWIAEKRDGADVACSWVESFDTSADFAVLLAKASPVSLATVAAFDLDSQLGQYNIPIKKLAVDPLLTFSQAVSQLTAVVDQASLVNRQIGGYGDHILYSLQSLSDALIALKDAQTYPIFNSIERLKSAIIAYRLQQLAKQVNVSIYIVPKDQNLSSIATTLANSVSDVVKLNPLAASSAVVKAGTVIRYYAA